MNHSETDEAREQRISREVLVDAYTRDEQAIGWYYYLDETMNVPFEARCMEEWAISPLEADEVVQVLGMAPANECTGEMFVLVEWMDRECGVPLAQLEPTEGDSDTREAIADWHYWIGQGNRLC